MRLNDVRHIIHVAVIIVVVIVAFVIIRAASVPKSFGQYGHYRGESLQERMDLPVILESALSCQECHEEERGGMWPGYKVWQSGRHHFVTCANCHGNLKEHVERQRKVLTYENFVVTKEKSIKKCFGCHLPLAAKPATQPLFTTDEPMHVGFVEAQKEGEATEEDLAFLCLQCHPPHIPKHQGN